MGYDLRYWKYCDDLSVVDASLLIVGLNPGKIEVRGRPIEAARLVQPSIEGEDRYYFEDEFRAVFKALKNAILRDKLKANLVKLCRPASYQWVAGEPTHEEPAHGEKEFCYTALLFTPEQLFSTSNKIAGGYNGKVYYIEEPDWFQTTVSVDDLKSWLASKGDRPEFFYPEARMEGFQDENHPRYSPKLAAAVAAWEAVEAPSASRSVKQTIERWLRENAARFGLVDDDGNPLADVVADLAKVANWNTKGGAPRTLAQGDAVARSEDKKTNFQEVYSESYDSEEPIPF